MKRKSIDGVWGDDIELEAFSEIYSRPIEIYVSGIKPIRTFHEENEKDQYIEPIRIAYIGQCHYNSIKLNDRVNIGMMTTKFGEYENLFIDSVFMRKSNISN